MIVAALIFGLMTVIAAKSNATGAALVLGLVTMVALGVAFPAARDGVGTVLTSLTGAIGDGLARASTR